jgi:hypothetical protein
LEGGQGFSGHQLGLVASREFAVGKAAAARSTTLMRFVFAIASLSLACCSILVSSAHPAPNSWVCRAGFCRIDQIAGEAHGFVGLGSFAPRLSEDASDPYLWSDYGESLASNGEPQKAGAAFDHAVVLGPHLPPVLIRAAYFNFKHSQFDRGAALSNRILSETDAYDPVVFSYVHYYGQQAPAALLSAIPAAARPAQSRAEWVGANGSEDEVTDTFRWMERNRLMDSPTALDLTWSLWRRQLFRSARDVWASWTAAEADVPGSSQLLANPRFEDEPDGSPFDWSIPKQASVDISRNQGLELHFLGAANVKLDGIRQSATVRPGPYRLSAIVQSEDLTTDQTPFFRVYDSGDPNRLNVLCPAIAGTVAKSEMGCEFVVRDGTEALTIELARNQSERFDNKIAGTLHIFEVSLRRI